MGSDSKVLVCVTHKSLVTPIACVCTGAFESLPTLVVITGAQGLLNHPVLHGKLSYETAIKVKDLRDLEMPTVEL
jgi:hypothetical protein